MEIRGMEKLENYVKENEFKIRDAHAIKADNINLGMELHPNFRKTFISFFGKINYMNKFVRLLSKGNAGIKLLSSTENDNYFREVRSLPTVNIENYWAIVKLVQVDRVLSEAQIVKRIIDSKEDWEDKRFSLYSIIKTGVVKNEVLDKRMSRYAVNLKDIFNLIIETYDSYLEGNFKEVVDADKSIFDKDNYKHFKNSIKETMYNEVVDKIDGELLSSFDIPNDEVKEMFLR